LTPDLKAREKRPSKMFSKDLSTEPFAMWTGYLWGARGWWQRPYGAFQRFGVTHALAEWPRQNHG